MCNSSFTAEANLILFVSFSTYQPGRDHFPPVDDYAVERPIRALISAFPQKVVTRHMNDLAAWLSTTFLTAAAV